MENKHKIILANQSQHIMWHSWCVLCVCVGKEKSLINEDKQEVLPKLSSQAVLNANSFFPAFPSTKGIWEDTLNFLFNAILNIIKKTVNKI